MADTIYGKTVGGLLMDAAGNVYDTGAGLLNFARNNPEAVGLMAGQMAPGAGTADASGFYPDPMNPSQNLPSLRQNISQGNYLDAGFQGLGLLGDAAMAVPPAAAALKAPRAAQLANRAAGIGHNRPPTRETSLADPANSLERYQGAAEDRTNQTLVRYKPAVTPRLAASIDGLTNNTGGVKDAMLADVQRGLELGGADWYNTEELRDWFVDKLGEARGNAEWSEYMDLVGMTSAGSKVPANIKNASYMRSRVPSGLLEEADALVAKEKKRPKGYGHKIQATQNMTTQKYARGDFDGMPEPDVAPSKGSNLENPKPRGFAQSLKGSQTNIAADLHFTRYFAMASKDPRWIQNGNDVSATDMAAIKEAYGKKAEKYFRKRGKGKEKYDIFDARDAVDDGLMSFDEAAQYPGFFADKPNANEYGHMEDITNELAREVGLTGPQFQAALWMGAADRTGVDPTSQGTFMDLFRRQVAKRAKETNRTDEEVLEDFIVNRGLLALPATAAGGAVTYGLLAEEEQRQQQGLF